MVFDGMTEGRFLGNGFATGVDRMAGNGRVLGPGWYESPFHQVELIVVSIAADHPDQLSRGDVVMRLKVRNFLQAEYLRQKFRGNVCNEPTAHY